MRQGQDWHGAETMAPIPSAFKYFIGAAAIFIAGCSAFFSVCGLGMLFVGSATAVMIMASSLEVGKLVAASLAFGLAVLAAACMPSLALAGLAMVAVGVCSINFSSLGNSILQLSSAPLRTTLRCGPRGRRQVPRLSQWLLRASRD